MNRILLGLVLALWSFLPVASSSTMAAETVDGRSRAKTIAPVVGAQTSLVFYADLSALDVAAAYKQFKVKLAPLIVSHLIEPESDILPVSIEKLRKAGGTNLYLVTDLIEFPRNRILPFVQLPEGAEQQQALKDLVRAKCLAPGIEEYVQMGSLLGIGPAKELKRLAEIKPDPRPELELAFVAAKDAVLQFHVVPSADQRKVLREMIPDLPAAFGPDAKKTLTDGVRCISLTIHKPDLSEWRLTIHTTDPAAAAKVQVMAASLLAIIQHLPADPKLSPKIDKLAQLAAPKAEDNRVTVSLSDAQGGLPLLFEVVFLPAMAQSRNAAMRMQSMTQLKQMGLAMHNFVSHHRRFPGAAIRDKAGKPLLSWRVAILPYMAQEALYKEFHLDEAWDSPHNKKLIEKMPRFYHSPTSKAKLGYTTYLAPIGEQTAFSKPEGLRLRDFTDGTSNTLLLLEGSDAAAVIWTKPDDWQYDPKQPSRDLLGQQKEGFLALCADGSARLISRKVSDATLKAVMTANGGEITGDF